jgi:hypothetical protein
MADLVNGWKDRSRRGKDQLFLAKKVYPLIKENVLIHSDIIQYEGESVAPFPRKRQHGEYVGSGFDENERPLLPYEEVVETELQEYPLPKFGIISRVRRKLISTFIKVRH